MTKQTSNAKAYMYKMIYNKISVHCDKKLRVFQAPEKSTDAFNILIGFLQIVVDTKLYLVY